ncbi:MAG: gliding motility-associated C-terminal domain-containing protein [Chitinophagaceae bacterium]
MRFNRLQLVILLLLFSANVSAQYWFNCARDTVLPGCPPAGCFSIKARVPDPQRGATTYAVNSPVVNPACLLAAYDPAVPQSPTMLNVDDRYTNPINIGFPFVFFGNVRTQLLASSNGYVCFDLAEANQFSHWSILNGGVPQDLPSTFYDREIIMGPYHDIDVSITTSPNRLISYVGSGISPYRTWTLSYYKIPLFSGACNNLIENTHTITLYESNGIIDVALYDMQICPTWNQGRSMVGLQNFGQNIGVMVPGRRASDPPWGSVGMSEKYRFVPIGGVPLFRRAELYDMAGTLVATGTSVPLANGDREVTFPNICPPPGTSTQYEVRAFYDKIDDITVEVMGRDTIRVDRQQGLAASTATTDANCGVPDGTITVSTVSGGNGGPYEYSLDGITWQSSNIFTGLLAGTYTVYIRDIGGVCTGNYSATVGVIGNLAAVTANTAASCTGVNNGTITVNSSTGTAPFTFSLDGGAFTAGTLPYTFTNLAPGNHTVVVRDVNNCVTNTITINITTGTGVTASTSFTQATCAGVNNGTITVNVTAGTAPFTYQLGANPPQASNVFTGLAPGTYSIIVTDAAGCTRTLSRTVTAGSGINANAVPSATSCNGAANGSITVTPTSGTAPYTFTLDGGTPVAGAAPFTFSNLSAGAHTIRVTDAAGCVTNIINVNIPAGPALAATAAANATSCNGATNGTITVTPTNGNAPYTFALDGAAPVTGAAPYTFTNVTAGPHTVVMTDAAGCVTGTINVNVTAGPALITTASKTDVLCNAGATGTITVTQPTIGAAPYEYSLDGITWQSSNNFTGLIAGTYTVYYREANGCQGTLSITVNEPTALTASAAMVPVVCNGQNNGIITVTSGGGVTPYDYSIDGGATWQTSNVFNVVAGSHTVIIRDANNCTTTQTISVTEPAALTAISANGPASCDGGNDGVITVTANGGNSGYQYSIDGTTFQSSNVFNVAPGNYTVTVKDNLGCITTFNTTVVLGSNFTLTPQTDPTICEGTSTQLQLTSNATQYAWTPSTGLSSTTISNPVANPTATTTYYVTATLGRCSGEDTVIVNVNAAPIPDAGADGFICYGQTYQLQASGGTQYSWTPNTYLDNPNIANPVSTPAKDVTYTLSILSDINGCASLTTDQIRIDVTPPIKIKTFPYDTVMHNGDMIQLLAVPSDTDVINYVWSPSTGLSDPNIANPIVTAGAVGDVAHYQVIASTIAGCKGEGYVTVRVYKGPEIYMPTGFTPNGDGKNDKFTPFPVGIKSYKYFRVFNRWGQLVFSTTKMHDGWDGKLGGRDQPSGVYVWMIEGMTKDDRAITKKGTVTLIR